MSRADVVRRSERGSAGAGGVFEFFCLRGKPGQQFEDLFEGAPGSWQVKDPDLLVQHRVIKNKWTKRGLSALMHNMLSKHTGGAPFVPSAIDAGTAAKNPFLAFFCMGDGPGKAGDARITWDESDGEFDTLVPPLGSVPGEGRRSILLNDDTTGPGLKRVSISYPTTTPYREVEYVLFAQVNTATYATGQVVVQDGATVVDGATIEINDGLNPALTFEMDSSASVTAWDGDPSNNIPIVFTGSDTQAEVRDKVIAKVNEVLDGVGIIPTEGHLDISAVAGTGGEVDLTHNAGGAIGNTTITVTGAGLAKTDFTGGGTALELGDDSTLFGYIDNLSIKSVGLANGRACSNAEADSQVGVRAVLGLAPTMQGHSDRVYVHESASLHLYAGGEDVDTEGDGYTESGHETVVVRAIGVDAADAIFSADNSIYLEQGDLSKADEGLSFAIVGATNNSGNHVISKVITRKRALLASAITTGDTGAWTSTDVTAINTGDLAFDGDITAEGVSGAVNWGQTWRSVDDAGPHVLGRIFGTALSDQITGMRVVFPANAPKDNCPAAFTIQFLDLDQADTPGDLTTLVPVDDGHWTTIDSPLTTQADNIFDGGEYGYEYTFTTPPAAAKCHGIRLSAMTAFNAAQHVRIAELVIFTTRGAITLVAATNDKLSLATDQTPTSPGVPNGTPGTMQSYSLGALATTGVVTNDDMAAVADAINKQVRGYELEALRSDLGFLWVRATVAGDETQLDLAAEGGDGANADLGLPATATSKVGTTQKIVKTPGQALSAIYRANISGDLPVV